MKGFLGVLILTFSICEGVPHTTCGPTDECKAGESCHLVKLGQKLGPVCFDPHPSLSQLNFDAQTTPCVSNSSLVCLNGGRCITVTIGQAHADVCVCPLITSGDRCEVFGKLINSYETEYFDTGNGVMFTASRENDVIYMGQNSYVTEFGFGAPNYTYAQRNINFAVCQAEIIAYDDVRGRMTLIDKYDKLMYLSDLPVDGLNRFLLRQRQENYEPYSAVVDKYGNMFMGIKYGLVMFNSDGEYIGQKNRISGPNNMAINSNCTLLAAATNGEIDLYSLTYDNGSIDVVFVGYGYNGQVRSRALAFDEHDNLLFARSRENGDGDVVDIFKISGVDMVIEHQNVFTGTEQYSISGLWTKDGLLYVVQKLYYNGRNYIINAIQYIDDNPFDVSTTQETSLTTAVYNIAVGESTSGRSAPGLTCYLCASVSEETRITNYHVDIPFTDSCFNLESSGYGSKQCQESCFSYSETIPNSNTSGIVRGCSEDFDIQAEPGCQPLGQIILCVCLDNFCNDWTDHGMITPTGSNVTANPTETGPTTSNIVSTETCYICASRSEEGRIANYNVSLPYTDSCFDLESPGYSYKQCKDSCFSYAETIPGTNTSGIIRGCSEDFDIIAGPGCQPLGSIILCVCSDNYCNNWSDDRDITSTQLTQPHDMSTTEATLSTNTASTAKTLLTDKWTTRSSGPGLTCYLCASPSEATRITNYHIDIPFTDSCFDLELPGYGTKQCRESCFSYSETIPNSNDTGIVRGCSEDFDIQAEPGCQPLGSIILCVCVDDFCNDWTDHGIITPTGSNVTANPTEIEPTTSNIANTETCYLCASPSEEGRIANYNVSLPYTDSCFDLESGGYSYKQCKDSCVSYAETIPGTNTSGIIRGCAEDFDIIAEPGCQPLGSIILCVCSDDYCNDWTNHGVLSSTQSNAYSTPVITTGTTEPGSTHESTTLHATTSSTDQRMTTSMNNPTTSHEHTTAATSVMTTTVNQQTTTMTSPTTTLEDPCKPNPCLNNATCSFNHDDVTCNCAPFCYGTYCETCKKPDPCALNLCNTGSTCMSVTDTTYKCICPNGFSGPYCYQNV